MRRRIGAAVCCLALVFQLAPLPRAQAAGYLCFVAVGESILPVSDSTMPFWRDGFLYVSASSLSSGIREALNIGLTANSEQVVLYRIGRRGTLRFDAGAGLAYGGMAALGALLCFLGGYGLRGMGRTVLVFPVFMASWLPLQVISLFKDTKRWHAIQHSGRRVPAGYRA